eukprot:SAG22_NODE_2850_length_2159_cov_1.780097_1_plen_136_part_00
MERNLDDGASTAVAAATPTPEPATAAAAGQLSLGGTAVALHAVSKLKQGAGWLSEIAVGQQQPAQDSAKSDDSKGGTSALHFSHRGQQLSPAEEEHYRKKAARIRKQAESFLEPGALCHRSQLALRICACLATEG